MNGLANQAPSITHSNAAAICDMALKAIGLSVERAVDFRDGYDFLVEGKVRIAVRYAFPASDREQIYRKRNGEVSRYLYKRWTFNFHRHGKLDQRYCDFFVCFLAGSDTVAKGSSQVAVYVIPWESITGLTFCSSAREGSTRGYRGKYARYRDGWDAIVRQAKGAAGPGRKSLVVSADHRKRLELASGAELGGERPPAKDDDPVAVMSDEQAQPAATKNPRSDTAPG